MPKKRKQKTKRERKSEQKPKTQGEQYAEAVRAIVMTARVLHMHDIPGLLKVGEEAYARLTAGPADAETQRKVRRLAQDIETLKVAMPLWTHADGIWKQQAQS
jgi:hypothetical protein